MGRKRAAKVPQTNDAEPTPARIPNADARFISGTMSAWKQYPNIIYFRRHDFWYFHNFALNNEAGMACVG